MNFSNPISGNGSAKQNRGVSTEELRRHNLATVLDLLHVSGPLSRSELADVTGLNRSTIGDLIGELTEIGMVEEGPASSTSGPGRPSPIATVRPDGAVVLAVEVTVDSIGVKTIGLGGHVYDEQRLVRPRARFSPKETIEDIARLAKPLLAGLPAGYSLAGVGLAVAGLVRRSDGFVDLAPNLGWRNTPLGEMARAELGIDRISMANEADMGALGEFRRGAGSTVGHLIYVAGEVGIGTGIIQNGIPMLGSAGYAGEAGHTMINPSGLPCRCGSIGCWETEAGEEALAAKAGIPDGTHGQALLDELIDRAKGQDSRTIAALEEIGRWLGLGVGNLINTFNPELVVIGGFYSDLYEHIEEGLHRGAVESALEAPLLMAEIRRCELGVDAPLIGAAELVLSEVISDPSGFAAGQSGETDIDPDTTPAVV